MFFLYGGIAPALRALKLGDNWARHIILCVIQVALDDAVFVRAECHDAAITDQTDVGQCIQHDVGGERLVSVSGGIVHGMEYDSSRVKQLDGTARSVVSIAVSGFMMTPCPKNATNTAIRPW